MKGQSKLCNQNNGKSIMRKNLKRFVSTICILCMLSFNSSAFAGWSDFWNDTCEKAKSAAHEVGQWVSGHKEEIITVAVVATAVVIACNGGDPESARSSYSSDSSSIYSSDCSGGYTYKTSHSVEGPYRPFSTGQKADILRQNRERNGGVLRSDYSGRILEEPNRYTKGYTPSPYEAQIDHIRPRSGGGWNSASNAQVLSREENLSKSDNSNW